MRHSDLLSREECEVKLNGALNHAEYLRHRAQQVLHDAENEIVEFQKQSKKSMDDVVVAAAAVNDIALAENDGTFVLAENNESRGNSAPYDHILNMVSLTVASFVACWSLMCYIEPANLGGMPSTTTDDTDEDRPKIMKESKQQERQRMKKEQAEEKNKEENDAREKAMEGAAAFVAKKEKIAA